MSVSIIISILKYVYRLKYTHVNSLLHCALQSQLNKTRNSGNTQTFTSIAMKLASQLELGNVIGQLVPITQVTGKIKSIGKAVKDKCNDYFTHRILDKINALKDTDSKLVLFAEMKTNYTYEKYLNSNCAYISSLTKFRLSAHNLPIERGRYARPPIERNLRTCKFCKLCVGNEIHALLYCKHEFIKDLRDKFLPQIYLKIPNLKQYSDHALLLNLLNGEHPSILPILCEWLSRCNLAYK